MTVIRQRDRDTLIQALRAGVVPRVGQHLIQVGRIQELAALMKDVEHIADGGSSFRLVVGDYGSGKTFFLNLVRSIAMEKKLVTVHADLTPDRRLHASSGQARNLYAELVKNMSTRTRPEGGALPGVVEKFVAQAKADATATGRAAEAIIRERLADLSEMVGGYDFAEVVAAYCRGFEEGNDTLKADALRWLRGEFATRTDARAALGVRTIIDDASVHDHLKLLGRFVRLAGYAGLMVCLDEMVNLYKLANTQARNANYEQILRVLNDALQGTAEGLGFVLGGTPEFLMDGRRGLYSYAALQSRLATNTFASDGLVDYSGPVIRLAQLSPEDFFVLLHKLRHVFAGGDPAKYLLPEEGLTAFMSHCAGKLGEQYFRSPRTTTTAFINLLAVLEQNPGAQWQALVGSVEVVRDSGAAADHACDSEDAEDDELASFAL